MAAIFWRVPCGSVTISSPIVYSWRPMGMEVFHGLAAKSFAAWARRGARRPAIASVLDCWRNFLLFDMARMFCLIVSVLVVHLLKIRIFHQSPYIYGLKQSRQCKRNIRYRRAGG